MRVVPISEEEVVYINGSILTLFYYKEEFNRDFLEDMIMSVFDGIVINNTLAPKLLWAMVKTYDSKTVSYSQWSRLVDLKGSEWHLPFIQELNNKFTLRDRGSTKKDDEPNESPLERYDLSLLVNAINMNIPLEILNDMSIDTLLDYQEIYMGEGERKAREATQEDIDAFFS